MITPVSLLFIPGTNTSPMCTFIASVFFSDVDTRALAYMTIDINRRVMIWYGFINILNTLTQLNEQLSICLLNEVGDGCSFRFEKRQLCSISIYWLSFILWCFICHRGPILRISPSVSAILTGIVVHPGKVCPWRLIASHQTSPLGALSPFHPFWTLISNGNANVSELQLIELHNCYTSNEPSSFGLQCLAPLNFANTTAAANTMFQQCTVDDSFNWSAIFICSTPVITVSRYRSGFSIVHHLSTYLSGSNRIFDCYSTVDPEVTSTAPSPPLSFTACTNGKVGVFCNETFDLCIVLQACKNNGNCSTTNSSSYTCSCPRWKFISIHCETDIRPCQPDTCFNNARCNETSPTFFVCQCEPGYEGQHCERLTNYCRNTTCQTNGQCRSRLLNFTCECTTTSYSGHYCEEKSAALVVKQTVSRSFAYIAILAISFLFGFIIVTDVSKYVFKIDPVAADQKRAEKMKTAKRTSRTKPIIVQRFIYVNWEATLWNIPEEWTIFFVVRLVSPRLIKLSYSIIIKKLRRTDQTEKIVERVWCSFLLIMVIAHTPVALAQIRKLLYAVRTSNLEQVERLWEQDIDGMVNERERRYVWWTKALSKHLTLGILVGNTRIDEDQIGASYNELNSTINTLDLILTKQGEATLSTCFSSNVSIASTHTRPSFIQVFLCSTWHSELHVWHHKRTKISNRDQSRAIGCRASRGIEDWRTSTTIE